MNFLRKLFGSDNPEIGSKRFEQLRHDEKEKQKTFDLLNTHSKTAYIPIIKFTTPAFNDLSKLGGLPYLTEQHLWPVCPNCKIQMPLLVQLDLDSIPEVSEIGILQLFYCTNKTPYCEGALHGWDNGSEASVVRKVPKLGLSIEVEVNIPYQEIEEKQIVDWKKVTDYPHPESYNSLKLEQQLKHYQHYIIDDLKLNCIDETKLLGWPFWAQAEDIAYDSSDIAMEMIFQLNGYMHPYEAELGHIDSALLWKSNRKQEFDFSWSTS